MMVKQYLRILSSVVLLLTLGCSSHSKSDLRLLKASGENITILHTNDHHGHFWSNSNSEWGMPARATLVEKIRNDVSKAGGHVLLLSAGDVNTGTPASDMAKAKPDFLGMNYMRYDAMAIGNHEFDNEFKVLKSQETLATFPFLSANLYFKNTRKRPFQPYIIRQVGSVKVAIIGLTTNETPSISLAFPKDTLELRSPIEEAMELVPKLQNEADLIIALTHMGHYKNGEHRSAPPGDVTLAREVPGIDLIVGGHSQNPLFNPDEQKGAWIVQADDSGKYLGKVDLFVTKNKATKKAYNLLPINHASGDFANEPKLKEDSNLVKILKPFQESALGIMQEKVGSTTGLFEGDRSFVRYKEAPIANMLTQIMRDETGADISLMASGIIRSGLPKGEINFGHILIMQPFNLEFLTVELTGKELHEYLNAVVKKLPGDGAMPQFSGVHLVTEGGELVSVLVNGSKLKGEVKYKVAIPDFHINGGGGYPVLSSHPTLVKTGKMDALSTKKFFKENSPVNPKDFEVTNYLTRR